MGLPIKPNSIPDTTGDLHTEIKLRNINAIICLIKNNPDIYGADIERALSKMRFTGVLTEFNELAINPDMPLSTIFDIQRFNEWNLLTIDFLTTPVEE